MASMGEENQAQRGNEEQGGRGLCQVSSGGGGGLVAAAIED